MTPLSQWLDPDAIERQIASRHIHRTRHPTLPLSLFDYTSRAQFEAHWTPETLACRGLVVHDDGHIVARPLDKFFNLGEHESTRLEALPQGPLEVTDKLDGSLVILRQDPDGPTASTRGSFVSEQALWATDWIRTHARLHDLDPDITICAEFVSGPRNRVVLDYGEREEVIMVAARRISTGQELPRPELEALSRDVRLPLVPHRVVDSLDRLVEQAMEATGIEGWVVRFPDGRRVKLKVPEYRHLHKLLFTLTPAAIRDGLRSQGADALLMGLPEELWDEVRLVIAEIEARIERRKAELQQRHAQILAAGGQESRRRYAELVQRDPESKYLFTLLDGRDIRPALLPVVDLSGLEQLWTNVKVRRSRLDQ
jgi:RNA ligase